MSRRDEDDVSGDERRKPSRPGLPVDVYRLLRALRRGRSVLVLAAMLGLVTGVAVAKLVIGHTYEAGASLQYEGKPGQQAHEAQRDLPSLVAVAHSESMMIALRERMGLESASIDAMRNLVHVESDPGSGLVTFIGTGKSATEAANMANSLVELFLAHHRERRTHEVRTLLAGLDERIAAAEQEVEAARARYDEFRELNRITDLSAEQEQAISQAAELRSEADLTLAEVEALEARVTQLRRALDRTPRMQAVSAGNSDDAARLRELRARLTQARSSRSDEHPEVQALTRQVRALERQVRSGAGGTPEMGIDTLHAALRTSLAEAETELEAARHRAQSLEALAAEAAERTSRYSAIEGQAAAMLAQVNVKQALLEELSSTKARAADELRDVRTGFRIVSEARPPESARRSKKKHIVAATVPMLFVALAAGGLIFRELRGLYVKTPAETAWWGNGPVIGATIWPRDPRALLDLIADMDDVAPDARGTILVVAATENERDLAHEIASQLNHDFCAAGFLDIPNVRALPAPRTNSTQGERVIEVPPPSGRASIVIDGAAGLALAHEFLESPEDEPLRGPTELTFEDDSDADEPERRLICTAWAGPGEGQALRRAARLADRVLVVVTSEGIRATDLAQMKGRLGRQNAVGYVLVGIDDDVARLEDRAGPIEEFWEGGAGK